MTFTWKKLNDHGDDLICRTPPYLLRVEQMGPANWWWAVSQDGRQLNHETFAGSKTRAMGRAEGFAYGHHTKTAQP